MKSLKILQKESSNLSYNLSEEQIPSPRLFKMIEKPILIMDCGDESPYVSG